MPPAIPRSHRAEPLEPDLPAGPASGSSIRVASEVTGLPMETLRVWERRYGFPRPVRREGSNRRLYSAEDVERLGWVARALRRGYRPGDVIDKALPELRALLGEGDPAQAGAAVADRARPEGARLPDVPGVLALLARDDVAGVEAELRLAAAALGARRFVTDVAHPLSVAVGDAWAAGHLAIRQEHLLSECLTTQLRQLLGAQHDVAGAPVAVLANLPTEPHTLGLQMAAVYLASGGMRPRLLGAETPPEQFVEAARAMDARVAGLTVTQAADLAATRRALRRLVRDLPRHVTVWVGGGAAERAVRDIGRALPVGTWSALDAAIAAARASPRGS